MSSLPSPVIFSFSGEFSSNLEQRNSDVISREMPVSKFGRYSRFGEIRGNQYECLPMSTNLWNPYKDFKFTLKFGNTISITDFDEILFILMKSISTNLWVLYKHFKVSARFSLDYNFITIIIEPAYLAVFIRLSLPVNISNYIVALIITIHRMMFPSKIYTCLFGGGARKGTG